MQSHTHTSAAHGHNHTHQTTYDSSGTATSYRQRAFGAGSSIAMQRFVNTSTASTTMSYELTDADATSTTPGATGGPSVANVSTNNPPFVVVNWIIKT
jgi:hypothetical protein